MTKFDQIFQEYYHVLLLYSLKFIGNDSDANDLVQEVFVAVWEKKKYNLEKRHLKSYLFNAVRNSCYNYLKHKTVVRKHLDEKVQLSNYELDFYNSGEKSLIEKEDLAKINAAINSLSDNYREVIVLSRFEGLKNKEIAERLSIPLRTVETRLFRALSKLRVILAKEQLIILFSIAAREAS